MIAHKFCAKCRREKPVEEFAFMESDRQRRKVTCESCLSNQREKNERTKDYRDTKHELEGVFRQWKGTAYSATSADTPATESSTGA